MEEEMKITKKQETKDTFTYICPFCKKELKQEYEKQLIHNAKVHNLNCKENPANKNE